MIYLSIALQQEAKALIEKLGLKLNTDSKLKWPVYTDSENRILLYISGIGPVSSSAATSAVLTAYPPTDSDHLINIGTCASCDSTTIGSAYLINKLTDATTGRTFYPDVFFSWDALTEAEIISSATPVSNSNTLADMESAFIYQAASYYLRPDQMHFIKIVSDAGTDSADISDIKISITKVMDDSSDMLVSIIDSFKLDNARDSSFDLTQLISDLHCSKTMEHQLIQLFRYADTLGLDTAKIISSLYKKGLVPCPSKKEGIKLLDYLTGEIIP